LNLPLRSISALTLAGALASSAHAVRLDLDGRGQVLIYPYYTARSLANGNAFVTAFSVVNSTAAPKAVRVRILEGKAGAEVLDFNLFLSAYDVWTAGIVGAGTGAGIFSKDNSCTSPAISRDASNPITLKARYIGDGFGDSLDLTLEGHFEIVEMGTIDIVSPLGQAVTHSTSYQGPNLSVPSCANLPNGPAEPGGLLRPTGGLSGSASFINVNEGTDFSIDAVVLSQWSDKVQWSASGSTEPNISSASPSVSAVVQSRADGDVLVVSRWNAGYQAVSAALMAERIVNQYTVEPEIKAGTDWIVTMPTKRFHVAGTVSDKSPFLNQSITGPTGSPIRAEPVAFLYYDREEQSPGDEICFLGPCGTYLPFVTTTLAYVANGGSTTAGLVLGGTNRSLYQSGALNSVWVNGWAELRFADLDLHRLVAPTGASKVIDTLTGDTVKSNATVTYFGLPVVGFAVESYSTTGLPGVNPNVISNYGGSFAHKYQRRIAIAP
jgi:hypothetical protein